MPKFSVKKPLTVFVAVIAVIVLGVVAYFGMTPDLLPNMDFPYVIVVTTYPGASPEKVETEVTKPLEQSMSTLEHIKEISSTSAENYSMVMMEFEEAADLDTIGVDIQQAISVLQGVWDDMVSAPYVLKINPSMLPVEVAALSMDGMDTVQLTEFLDSTLMSKLEGIPGVARVSTSGTVTQQLHVVLDQNLLDQLNKTLAEQINLKMDEASEELEKAKKELNSAQKKLDKGKDALNEGKEQLTGQTSAGMAEVNQQMSQLISTRSQLESTLSILKTLQQSVDSLKKPLNDAKAQLKTLRSLKSQNEELTAREAAFDAQIDQIHSSGKPQNEIDAEISALKASPEYVQLQADRATWQAQMTANSVTVETLDSRISLLESTVTSLEQRMEEMEKLLQEQGVSLGELDKQVKELEDGLKQVDEGIAMLKQTQQTLNKAQLDGLLDLSNAATELAVGQSTITAALQQVEEGEKTLATTRDETLSKTDLNNILTMEMVANILTAQNFSMPAGTIQGEGVSYMLSVGEELTTARQLEELLLFDMNMEGVAPVYLKDVAAILVTDNRNETYAKLDQLDSIVLSFEKQSTYATAETTDNILARFAQLEAEYEGLRFVSLMNQGDYIYLIVETILSSLLLGAVFAVLILLLFLRDLRPTVITLCSIPISVVFAIVLMYFSGVTLNMISLSALAVSVGMLVDNSVVVIENIYRLRAKGANAIQAAVSGAQQVAGAVTASTLTTVCVFAPIVFVEGITRQLFTDLALTMTYALMASLIVALTLVPAMASGMLRKSKENTATMPKKLMAGYETAVRWSLDHKPIVLIAAVVLLVGSALWSISRGFIFMPSMDSSTVTVNVAMPEDASMEDAVKFADEVLAKIATIEDVKTTGATMGGSLMGNDENKNVTIYAILKDETASGAAVAKKIEALCEDMQAEVSASSAMMDMSMLSGSGISLRIYSDDMDALQSAAKTAGEVLEQLDGVAEVSNGLEDTAPALHVNIDRNKAMQKGITVAQVYMELAAALQSSTTVTTLNLEGTSTQLIVEKPEAAILTVDKLESYPFSVTTQTGEVNEFLLSDIATVEQTTSLNSISRSGQRRYLTVGATLEEGKNVTLVTAEANQAIKKASLGSGVTYEFAGENETIMEAIEQLFLMLLLGILLVYFVMVAQFQSLKSPFIVMFTIPLAFTGGFLALILCGMEVSVISLIGFVMLTGIIVNNGIVLIDYINQLRLEGRSCREAILEAGATRIRPILMTTITTILGLVDMAVRKNIGTAIMQPVAVVCIGGLIYATLMTLFVVPIIYEMMNKKDLRKVDEADLEILDI